MAGKTMDSQGHLPDGTSALKPLEAEDSLTKAERKVPLLAKLWPGATGVLWVLGVICGGYQTEVPGKTMCLSNLRIRRSIGRPGLVLI